jgi:hypothetical protein
LLVETPGFCALSPFGGGDNLDSTAPMAGQCSGPGAALGPFRVRFGAVAGARRGGNPGTWESGNLTPLLASPGRQISSFSVLAASRAGPDGRDARAPASVRARAATRPEWPRLLLPALQSTKVLTEGGVGT